MVSFVLQAISTFSSITSGFWLLSFLGAGVTSLQTCTGLFPLVGGLRLCTWLSGNREAGWIPHMLKKESVTKAVEDRVLPGHTSFPLLSVSDWSPDWSQTQEFAAGCSLCSPESTSWELWLHYAKDCLGHHTHTLLCAFGVCPLHLQIIVVIVSGLQFLWEFLGKDCSSIVLGHGFLCCFLYQSSCICFIYSRHFLKLYCWIPFLGLTQTFLSPPTSLALG